MANTENLCTDELADQWGYGQRCMLPRGHRGLHRHERADGFILRWGWEE